MFTPKYNISNKLLANIKKVAEITTELNSRRFSFVVLAEFEKKAREISTYSSVSIEGNPLPLTEVRQILKTKPEYIRDSEKEILNYNKALSELNEYIKEKKYDFDLSLLLKIQKSITRNLIDKYRCGRIRKEPVFVNDPRTSRTIYLPPNHDDVPGMLTELLKYIKQNEGKIDPLILAGIFHKQFVIIHPFIDGNGRTARLSTKALLAKMGLNTFNLFSFENYYNKNVSRYFQQVGVIGNYYDLQKDIDFSEWLEYFTDGIIDELLRVKKELELESNLSKKSISEHQNKIIWYVKENGSISDKEYAKITDRARATRSLDLKRLVEAGEIKRVGHGRATYYQLNY